MKKLAYINLGCPKNQVDLEIILGGMSSEVQIVSDITHADIVLINTCAFIEPAKQESIDEILNTAAFQQGGHKVFVSGCLPQRYQEELALELPEVDRFFFSKDPYTTLKELKAELSLNSTANGRYPLSPSHYAFLRLSDGCNNRCSYCAIPLIKGELRSRTPEEIYENARQLANQNVKELILIAQDITSYGSDLDTDSTLSDVLQELNRIQGIRWIRLLYTHPAHWSDRLIDVIADSEHIVPYVDMPIQHISDEILKRMGRLVTRRDIENLIVKLRQRIPDLALRTSVITGFPGETEEQFNELAEFIQNIQFDRLGVFTYSHEEGTRAFQWPDSISESEKRNRQSELMQLQSDISFEKNTRLVGKQLEVVADNFLTPDIVSGRTVWDAPEIDNSVLLNNNAVPGSFYRIKITSADVYDLQGEIVSHLS